MLPSVISWAQEPPTVTFTADQAAQEALEHNLTLLAERYNLSVAEARVVTAGLRPNPVLTFNAAFPDHTIYHNNINPYSEMAHIDFVFERGAKRESRLAVAENAKEVTRLQFLNTVRTLLLDVQNACVDVLLAKNNLTLAQENLHALNEVVQISTHRVRAGDLADVELQRVSLTALQYQNQVRKRESDLLIARKELQVLVGRSLQDSLVDVSGELRREGAPTNVEAVLHQALNLRPDLQALQRDQARSAADLRLQIAQGVVDYTIGAEYQRQQSPSRDGNQYGVSLSVPLPVFNRNQGEILRAQEEHEQLAVKLRALEADVRKEVQAVYQRYQTAQETVQRIESEMLGKAEAVRNTMAYTYQRGASSLLEYLDAQRTFNETRQSYNEARADYARGLYQLDAVTGQAVTPEGAP
jgi:cobalt-zinc-cadmium efflux system outer membrane protein